MARVALPIQEALRDMFSELLDRYTAVDKGAGAIVPDEVGATVTYRDKNERVTVVAVFDRSLVGILGAALVMMPAVALQEVEGKAELPENLVENFWEVANIMVSLLNRPQGPHLALADRYTGGDELGEDVQGAMARPLKTRHFVMNVTGYGTGRLSLLAV